MFTHLCHILKFKTENNFENYSTFNVTFYFISYAKLATRAIEPSFGLLFGDLLKELHVETLGASIIMSVYDVMMNFSGLFVGPLLKEFSYRKVAIAGSLLCSLGLALTSPASSMAHILATYSVINGKFLLLWIVIIHSFIYQHWISTISGLSWKLEHIQHLNVCVCGCCPSDFQFFFPDKDDENDLFYQF